MTTRAPWKDIESLLFKFKQHTNTVGNYPNIHKMLNQTYSNGISGTKLNDLFDDATRAKIKPDAISILRDKIVTDRSPYATLTTDKALIKQYIGGMVITSPLANNHSLWRNSTAIERTFLHAQKNKQTQIIVVLSINHLYFHPGIPICLPSTRASYSPLYFEYISTTPFVVPMNPNTNPNPVPPSPGTNPGSTFTLQDMTTLRTAIGLFAVAST